MEFKETECGWIWVLADGTCGYCGMGFNDIFDHLRCLDKAQETVDQWKRFEADPRQRSAVENSSAVR